MAKQAMIVIITFIDQVCYAQGLCLRYRTNGDAVPAPLRHPEQLGVHCLAQKHFNTWTTENGNRTPDHSTS